MSNQPDNLIEAVIEAHRAIFRSISASSAAEWMGLDLSMAQLKILMVLHASGPTAIGQIAETHGIGQPTASHLVDRLVQAQLAERAEDPQDRRRTLAQLSPAGQGLAERLRQLRFDPLRRWLAQLDPATLASLAAGTQALADVAAAERAASPIDP